MKKFRFEGHAFKYVLENVQCLIENQLILLFLLFTF